MNELEIKPVIRSIDIAVVHVESVYAYVTSYQVQEEGKLRD